MENLSEGGISKSPTDASCSLANGRNQNIKTLSDGVILSSPEEANQAALSLLNSNPSASVSQTPLVDSTHSPSSTRRIYHQMATAMDEDIHQNDVWKKREHFMSTGHSHNIEAADTADVKGTADNNVFLFPSNGTNGTRDSQNDIYSEGVEKTLDALDSDMTVANETEAQVVRNGNDTLSQKR